MKDQVSTGIADPRGKSVRARRSENVSTRQIASCCHEDNATTGSSRSSHACSPMGAAPTQSSRVSIREIKGAEQAVCGYAIFAPITRGLRMRH